MDTNWLKFNKDKVFQALSNLEPPTADLATHEMMFNKLHKNNSTKNNGSSKKLEKLEIFPFGT